MPASSATWPARSTPRWSPRSPGVRAPSRSTAEFVPAVNAVMNITQGAIMAKAALREAGVIASAAVRLPLVEATATRSRWCATVSDSRD